MTEQRPTIGIWDPSYERKAVPLLAVGFGLVGLDRWIIASIEEDPCRSITRRSS